LPAPPPRCISACSRSAFRSALLPLSPPHAPDSTRHTSSPPSVHTRAPLLPAPPAPALAARTPHHTLLPQKAPAPSPQISPVGCARIPETTPSSETASSLPTPSTLPQTPRRRPPHPPSHRPAAAHRSTALPRSRTCWHQTSHSIHVRSPSPARTSHRSCSAPAAPHCHASPS